jgi:hypothetical protein
MYQPSGSLVVLTVLVSYFAMIFMSLALPSTSLISWQYLLHEDFAFPYFFVVKGEGFLLGIPLTCSFSCIK